MYKKFRIENFRGFDHLEITDLSRINLIAGMNNVGKSNLLEALFVHAGAYNPGLLMTIRGLRGFDRLKIERGTWVESPFAMWFYQKNVQNEICLTGEDQKTGYREISLSVVEDPSEIPQIPQHSPGELFVEEENGSQRPAISSTSEIVQALKLKTHVDGKTRVHYLVLTVNRIYTVPFPPAPLFPTFITTTRGISNPEPELYTGLVKKGGESAVLEILKIIDPRVEDVFLLTEAEQTRLWARLDFGAIPLLDMGQGAVHLTNLVIRIANAQNGVLLIDEIDNGLHYTILPEIWKFIGKLAREFNTQVFATTHSRECIRAGHEAFASTPDSYDFRLFRLQRTSENKIEAVKYDQDTLEIALETGLEVR